MEACLSVEKEVDRVFSKFGGINDHVKKVLYDLVTQIQNLKKEYQNGKSISRTKDVFLIDVFSLLFTSMYVI